MHSVVEAIVEGVCRLYEEGYEPDVITVHPVTYTEVVRVLSHASDGAPGGVRVYGYPLETTRFIPRDMVRVESEPKYAVSTYVEVDVDLMKYETINDAHDAYLQDELSIADLEFVVTHITRET